MFYPISITELLDEKHGLIRKDYHQWKQVICGNEIVLSRKNHLGYEIKVYTSISNGELLARSVGSDAIRVIAIKHFRVNGQQRAKTVFKGVSVHRTGTSNGIVQRTRERMLEAYKACEKDASKFKR